VTRSPKVNAKVRVLNVDTGTTPELSISGMLGVCAWVTVVSVTSGGEMVSESCCGSIGTEVE
jgi:hypothetical protein